MNPRRGKRMKIGSGEHIFTEMERATDRNADMHNQTTNPA